MNGFRRGGDGSFGAECADSAPEDVRRRNTRKIYFPGASVKPPRYSEQAADERRREPKYIYGTTPSASSLSHSIVITSKGEIFSPGGKIVGHGRSGDGSPCPIVGSGGRRCASAILEA